MATHDVYSTLKSHANTAWVHFALDFKPQIGAVIPLAQIAAHAEYRIEKPSSQIIDASRYLIRDPLNQTYYIFDSRRFFCQTLSLSSWLKNQDNQIAIMREALATMQISSIQRAGLAISASCDLEMTHQELCALMFGSFLANEMEFEPVFGKPEDIHLTIYGSYKTVKSRATLTPQTAKQAVEGFLGVQNLDLFLEDKYQPEIITRFRERMARDSLFVSCDFWREEMSDTSLREFTSESLDGIERVLDGSIRKIKSLRPLKANKHG